VLRYTEVFSGRSAWKVLIFRQVILTESTSTAVEVMIVRGSFSTEQNMKDSFCVPFCVRKDVISILSIDGISSAH
jgi:hypothetical protein